MAEGESLPCGEVDGSLVRQSRGSPHSPESSLGHCRQMASPAPNSSWIPHKSEGPGEREEEKQKAMNFFCHHPRNVRKATVRPPPPPAIPKLKRKNVNTNAGPALPKSIRLPAFWVPIPFS